MQVSIGMKCPDGHITYELGIGQTNFCPVCGKNFIPNTNSPGIVANYHCKKCGALFGILTGTSNCPDCGEPIQ